MADPEPPDTDDPPGGDPAAEGPADPGSPAGPASEPGDADATRAHDVEALFDEAAAVDDDRIADPTAALDVAAALDADDAAPTGEDLPQPVWADDRPADEPGDLTVALPPVPAPADDDRATTWLPPVATTQVLPPSSAPPAPGEPMEVEGDDPGGLSGGKIALIAGLVVLVALVIGVAAFLLTAGDGDDGPNSATPVALLDADDPGPAPYTTNTSARLDLARVRELAGIDAAVDEAPRGADDPVHRNRSGSDPGLYTAPRGERLCDRGRIGRDLEAAPSKRDAWAGITGIPPGDTTTFLDSLTPVALLADTRLGDHRFEGGRSVATQVILQAGTAVLVDDRGLPRVRCASGSPLLPPIEAADGIAVTGSPWAGFSLDRVQVVRAGQPQTVLVVVDLASGEPFSRPVGTDGDRDAPIGGATTTTTGSTTTTSTTSTTTSTSTTSTTTTSTTSTTTTAPPAATDVTGNGSATASSVIDGFGPQLAIDGDVTTSWFGEGAAGEPGGAVFTWEHPATVAIERIAVVGNGAHADPGMRTGTGFDSVTIEVLDNGTVTYSETFGLPGSPDPSINARPDAPGNTVRITFIGPEGADAAGFGELTIIAA